jgi:hypothetical protein
MAVFHQSRYANGGNHQDCTWDSLPMSPLDVRFRANRTLEPTSPQDRF